MKTSTECRKLKEGGKYQKQEKVRGKWWVRKSSLQLMFSLPACYRIKPMKPITLLSSINHQYMETLKQGNKESHPNLPSFLKITHTLKQAKTEVFLSFFLFFCIFFL